MNEHKKVFSMISDRISTFRSSVAFSNSDIGFSNDTPKWRYLKKQMMAALKQNGDGLKNLESKTLLYGEQLLKKMEEHKGSPFEPGRLIHLTLAHIMLILIFGQSSDSDAAACIQSQNNLEEVLEHT